MTSINLDARELKKRTDLVLLASRFTRLRHVGRQFVGLCPLHRERSPSFVVHPKKQVFHCFGCGSGGDVFAFMMAVKACDFRTALMLVNEFLSGVALASEPRSGSRFGESEGGGSPLSSPKARRNHSQLSVESRTQLIEALERTNRRLLAIRKANREAAVVLATSCEPWTEEETLLLESQS
jgi:CHC2 zinc finger